MIVEMIIATMAVSDVGAVSTALTTSAVPQEVCESVKGEAGQAKITQDTGHSVTWYVRVQCIPMGQGVPPQVIDMFGAIINGIQRR